MRTVRVITMPDDPAIAALPSLFLRMHHEMENQGMMLSLAPNGAQLWLDSVRNGLERFHRISIAASGSDLIGFAHASLKLAPEHLGGARIGHIGHVFVLPEHRRGGTARALVQELHHWLLDRQVTSTELQVVQGNAAGLAFWRSLGYEVELVQLRKR